MNKKRMSVLMFVVLSAVTFGTSFAYSDELNIKLGYSEVDFFPYQMGNGNAIANPPGISLELITLASKELGLNIEFSRRPNKRIH